MSPSQVAQTGGRGYIVAVGGAEDKLGASSILKRFVGVSGGANANIAIVPTASREADTGDRYERLFKKLGAAEAQAVRFNDRADGADPKHLEALEHATGIFITGGDQLRLSAVLGGTPAAKMIRQLNASGVAVGGTSAGAAILCEHMIAHGTEGATPKVGMVTLSPGFGLTNRVIFDQHFRQRDRLGRLLAALAFNPFAIGVGLDEDTAAFIDAQRRIEVVGAGAITLLDASTITHSSIAGADMGKPICMTGIQLHVLTHGASYNLETRQASPA